MHYNATSGPMQSQPWTHVQCTANMPPASTVELACWCPVHEAKRKTVEVVVHGSALLDDRTLSATQVLLLVKPTYQTTPYAPLPMGLMGAYLAGHSNKLPHTYKHVQAHRSLKCSQQVVLHSIRAQIAGTP